MKTSLFSQSDEEGWKTVKSRKTSRSGNSRSFLNKNGIRCWIEAKGFSFTKGYGSKSGKFQIIESKGDRFSTLWVNQKGLCWFRKVLSLEITKTWSKSQIWQFTDSDDWLTVSRGKNNNGEYIKLSGPNSWGNSVDIYFPAGDMRNGWKQIISIINQLSPIQEVLIQKPQSSPSPVHFPNPPSVWNKPKLETEVLPIEKENWNHMVVLSSDANMVSWDLIGKHLGKCLEKNEVFFLQPFSNSKALFKVPNSEMRTELLSKSGWSFNGINFKFLPWTSKLNMLSDEEVLKIQSCWIEVREFHFLWNQKLLKPLVKCGGLL
ncbi:hypothetical protein MKW92_038484 [Papaver armeniacum]|nr:hypothetical protein MKW92_038484 [Papaver armeniacum]